MIDQNFQIIQSNPDDLIDRMIEILTSSGYEIWDGRVYDQSGCFAVLYSPGYGAGWSTWNTEHTFLLYSPPALALHLFFSKFTYPNLDDQLRMFLEKAGIEVGTFDTPSNKIVEILLAIYHNLPDETYICTLGFDSLAVEWFVPGTQFRIEEYDGSEGIVINHSNYWNS
jgi:hypothetical protein